LSTIMPAEAETASTAVMRMGGRVARTRRAVFVRQYLKNRGAVVGAVIVLLVILMAIFAPWIAPHDPYEMYMDNLLANPSSKFLMGTDQYGRDTLSRIIWGARISLQVGILANLFAVSFGMVIGLAAGYYGGLFDLIIMRVMDMIFAFPGLLLALAIIGIIGKRSLTWVMLALAIVWIPMYARLIRGNVLSAKENVYVEAARVIGQSNGKIMWRHILPNTVSPVIVVVTLCIGVAIRNAAGLSFLGMGVQPPTASWGNMLLDAQSLTILENMPWLWAPPGFAILITVLAINFIGDGLRDALDPRMVV